MICKQTPDAPKKKTGTNDPKKKKDIKTSSNKTETESSETLEAEEPAEEDETSSNFTDLQNYEPTPTEAFLLSRAGSQLAYTQIGTGSVRNARTKKWQDVKLLFDQA